VIIVEAWHADSQHTRPGKPLELLEKLRILVLAQIALMGKETVTAHNNKDMMWFFDVERSISFMCALSITLMETEGETHTYRISGKILSF
jgi:hypothetical protein